MRWRYKIISTPTIRAKDAWAADGCVEWWMKEKSKSDAANGYWSYTTVAEANAWAKALSLVAVFAKAEAEVKLTRNTPKGLIKNLEMKGELTGGQIAVTVAAAGAETVAAADAWAGADDTLYLFYKPILDAQADAAAGAESVAGANASAGSIAATLSKSLSYIKADTFGFKAFRANLMMGNLALSASFADVDALADSFAQAYATACTNWGKCYKPDDAEYVQAASFAHATAFAKALAASGLYASATAEYKQGGHPGSKRNKNRGLNEFKLSADAKVFAECVNYGRVQKPEVAAEVEEY